jgi:hypothetical protein
MTRAVRQCSDLTKSRLGLERVQAQKLIGKQDATSLSVEGEQSGEGM